MLEIDEQFSNLDMLLNDEASIKMLKGEFLGNLEWKDDETYDIYTDASKIHDKNSVAWVVMNKDGIK